MFDRATIESIADVGDLVHVEASMHTVEFDYCMQSSITGRFNGFIEDQDVLVTNDGGRLQTHPALITCFTNLEDYLED